MIAQAADAAYTSTMEGDFEMTGRRAIAGLSLFFALALCALVASSALGAELSTTSVTCVPAETGAQFSDEHCTKASEGKGKGFAHEAIPVEKQPELHGTNAKTAGETEGSTNAVLKFEAEKIKFEVACTSVETFGYLTNEEEEKEMQGWARKIETTYSGCIVQLPTKLNCKVVGGKFKTNSATFNSYKKGMAVEFELPEWAEASITVEKCALSQLNKQYPIDGTWLAEPNGATLKTTEAGTEKTLLVNEKPATLVTTVTLKAREFEGELFPVSFTTG